MKDIKLAVPGERMTIGAVTPKQPNVDSTIEVGDFVHLSTGDVEIRVKVESAAPGRYVGTITESPIPNTADKILQFEEEHVVLLVKQITAL